MISHIVRQSEEIIWQKEEWKRCQLVRKYSKNKYGIDDSDVEECRLLGDDMTRLGLDLHILS